MSTTQFNASRKVVKYLGIYITKDLKLLFKHDFANRLDALKKNIEKWRTLPLSMIGRANTIKVVSLPRFLYLIQNILICIPRSYFKQFDSVILPFIWGFKPHRISKQHLLRPKEIASLNLPCFLNSYWAANVRVMVHWQLSQGRDIPAIIPLWIIIKQSLI